MARVTSALFDESNSSEQAENGGIALDFVSSSATGAANGLMGPARPTAGTGLRVSESLGQLSSQSEPMIIDYDDPANDQPLLQELGINFDHITAKSKAVLNPLASPGSLDAHIMDDTDLAGPLVFCAALGFALLLRGKVHFGAIYGVGSIGCLGIYAVLNLMMKEGKGGIDFARTVSVLGYSLLPLVFLVGLQVLIPFSSFALQLAALGTIAWATQSASLFFVTVCGMEHQRWLVAYPIALVYSCFALMTVAN